MPNVRAYRRLLLDLRPGGLDRTMLRAAAELARLLDVEMMGVFVEDASIVGAASFPFTRELRLPAHDWHPASADRLESEMQAAAEQARLLLAREGQAAGISCHFEVHRGDPAATIAGLCDFHDIVAVAEPNEAIERLTDTAGRVREAALSSEATVLLLPSRPGRPAGAIVALISGADDPSLAFAARLAVTSGERLAAAIVGEDERSPAEIRNAAAMAGLAPERVEVLRLGGRTVHSVLHVLGGRHDRLVVLCRNRIGLPVNAPARLAEELRVPVLVIEPEPAAPARDAPSGA